MVALRMSQGFQLTTAYQEEGLTKGGDEYNDIEKARVVRQDGDIHPNGKWVWVSSAAGGKGDWRVIKKPKGDNPAPAAKSPKEEAKPAEGGASKKSKLQDKIEGMSPEELEALQKMVAGALAKKQPAAKTEEKPAAPAKKEKKKIYNVDHRGIPMDLTQLKDYTIKELLHAALIGINHANREISRGVGKIKLKRLNEALENERGKFAELKEEADRRGLKFDYKEEEYENGEKKKKEETKPAAKKEVRDLDGDEIPEGFTYFKGKDSVYNWFLLHAGEAWQADLGAGDQVIVAYMPADIQKQKSWPDDYAFFSANGDYATIRRRYGEKDEFEFFLEKEDALNAAKKLIEQSADSDNSSQGDEGDDDEAKKQDDKEFRDELKRAIEEGNLNSQPSKNKVESVYKSIRKRFGDKASVKLTEYGQPVVSVTFGDLELNVSYREDKRMGDEVITQWTLSGYDSDSSSVKKARTFKEQNDLYSPDIYLSALKMRAKDKLKSLEAQGSSSQAEIDRIKSELKRIESAEERVSNEFASK